VATHGCLCEESREILGVSLRTQAPVSKAGQTWVTTLTPLRCTGKFVKRLTGRSDPLGL